MSEVGDGRAQALDPARDEGAVDERAQPRMSGRLALQHGVGVDGVEVARVRGGLGQAELPRGGDVQDLAAETPVAQQAVHVRVAGEEPVPVLLPPEHRRLGVEPRIGRGTGRRRKRDRGDRATRRRAAGSSIMHRHIGRRAAAGKRERRPDALSVRASGGQPAMQPNTYETFCATTKPRLWVALLQIDDPMAKF